MARASYVYIVTSEDRCPLMAFTVKHEAITWLKTRSQYAVDHFHVYTVRDGNEHATKHHFKRSVSEFLEYE